MKVPYFDIRSHLLLWMILSSLFNVYQRQSTLRHSQSAVSAMLITEPRRTGGKYASITRCFLFWFSTCFKKKTMPERKRAAGDGNPSILAYFSKKARPLPDAGE